MTVSDTFEVKHLGKSWTWTKMGRKWAKNKMQTNPPFSMCYDNEYES